MMGKTLDMATFVCYNIGVVWKKGSSSNSGNMRHTATENSKQPNMLGTLT